MYNQLKSNDSRFEAYIQRFLVLTIHFQFYHSTQDAIASSTAAPGYSCYRLEFYQADPLVAEAACRGAHVNDNQAAYFKAFRGLEAVVKCHCWVLMVYIYIYCDFTVPSLTISFDHPYVYPLYCDFDGGLFIEPLATHKTGYRKDQLNTKKRSQLLKWGFTLQFVLSLTIYHPMNGEVNHCWSLNQSRVSD